MEVNIFFNEYMTVPYPTIEPAITEVDYYNNDLD
jgi:hypothetical protein